MYQQTRILFTSLLFGALLLAIPHRPAFADALVDDNPPPARTNGATPDYEISIRGDGAFVTQTRAALNLLATCAPQALQEADEALDTIREFNLSGMDVDTGTFLASNTTAFAPRFSRDAQIFWYAGTIVHDAHHRTQEQNGMDTNWEILTEEQREVIEADARDVQIQALQQCLPSLPQAVQTEGQYLLKYLTDMQSGVYECDYCKVEQENRTW